MTMRTALVAFALALAPAAARACSPVPFTPSATPERGEACAYYRYLTEIRAVGLSPATDLGGGFVLQHATDGNACYHEWNLVLYDCTAGELAVIGPARDDYFPENSGAPMRAVYDRLEAEAAAGHPMSLDAASELGHAQGFGAALRVRAGTRLAINGYTVPTDCACDTYYPRSGGN